MENELQKNVTHLGNNMDIIKDFPDNSIDSIVTDPPYGLGKEPKAVDVLKDWIEKGYHEITGKGFMGKEWDAFVPQPVFWKECLRVLKTRWTSTVIRRNKDLRLGCDGSSSCGI